MDWGKSVEDYYPVYPAPRWGYDKPVHRLIDQKLTAGCEDYRKILLEILAYEDIFFKVPRDATEPSQPHWNNYWFSSLDAAALMGLLLSRKPKRYIEIGSGHSTMFARYAIQQGSLDTKIISIDPMPRADIDDLSDVVIRSNLESCDLSIFNSLEDGDIVFYDGSHRVFTNSDTTVFFLDVLPSLPSGVIVHLHDIFLPADYPAAWNARLYSEQYMLAAMLLSDEPPFDVMLPNYYVMSRSELFAIVSEVFISRKNQIPLRYPVGFYCPPVSFWLKWRGYTSPLRSKAGVES